MNGAYLYRLGVTPYGEAVATMNDLAAARGQGAIPDTVMLLEHLPVITLGSRAVRGEELLLAAVEYTRRGIEVVEVSRGGRSTYHGPGQLVCYPVLDLHALRQGPAPLRRHARADDHPDAGGVPAEGHTVTGEHASGVWVGERKIASIGVRCARWVTTHGLR